MGISGNIGWFHILTLIPSYVIAVGMWYGIYIMNDNAKERAKDSSRKHKEAMANHDKSMRALEALIERTGG